MLLCLGAMVLSRDMEPTMIYKETIHFGPKKGNGDMFWIEFELLWKTIQRPIVNNKQLLDCLFDVFILDVHSGRLVKLHPGKLT